MTQRKPGNLTMPGWVDVQIRRAEEQGAFENLPGLGKPIARLDEPRHELAWVADYLRRENVDVAELLPPALAVAKEKELLRERLVRERSEAVVREVIVELNTRIDREHARPQTGPIFRVKRVPVEATVTQWRADRDALAALRPPAPTPRESATPGRRWWRRAG